MLIAERYRLEKRIGRGGLGQVWRATDEVLGRPVAVKILGGIGSDDAAAERFRMEARTAAALNHPNVVAVYDFGAHDERLFLVMELLDGCNLAEELTAKGPLEPYQVVGIGAQAAKGLAAAHYQQVVHRDIKPSNLMQTVDGDIKIADFGLAFFADQLSSSFTATGQVMGTTLYLAPERAEGGVAQPGCDVYSLGCVLYELLTGRPPFQADAPAALMYNHIHTPPPPPGEIRPDLPPALEDYLLRLLAKDPIERPSASEMARWLSTSEWEEDRPREPSAAAAAVTSPKGIPRTRSRRRSVAGAAGALAVAAAVGVAMTAVISEESRSDVPRVTGTPTPKSGTPSDHRKSGPRPDTGTETAPDAGKLPPPGDSTPRPSQGTPSTAPSSTPSTTPSESPSATPLPSKTKKPKKPKKTKKPKKPKKTKDPET